MARLGRPGMSDEMKADLWRRWRAGESISVISRQIGKPPGSVFTVLKHHGGIAPAPRKARAGSLTVGEREEISRGLCAGESYRAIAGLLGRAVSTISREVNKNGGRDVYRAIAAQERPRDSGPSGSRTETVQAGPGTASRLEEQAPGQAPRRRQDGQTRRVDQGTPSPPRINAKLSSVKPTDRHEKPKLDYLHDGRGGADTHRPYAGPTGPAAPRLPTNRRTTNYPCRNTFDQSDC